MRDLLMKHECHDYDFVTPANARQLAKIIANKLQAAYYSLHDSFDTGRIIIKEKHKYICLDISSIRGKELSDDLKLRDFTMNALAIPLHDNSFHLIDILGGARDIQQKTIRACSNLSFYHDPVRVLRAVRFAANLSFSIEEQTKIWLKDALPLLHSPSVERIRDEFFHILAGKNQASALRSLHTLGVFTYLFPQLEKLQNIHQPPPHLYDVLTHTIKVIEKLELIYTWLCEGSRPTTKHDCSLSLFLGMLDSVLGKFRQNFQKHFYPLYINSFPKGILFFAALFHDVGKAETLISDENGKLHFFHHEKVGAKSAMQKAAEFHMSLDEQHNIHTIIANHMRILSLYNDTFPPSTRAVYRYFRDVGSMGVEICLLALADFWATYDYTLKPKDWEKLLLIIESLLDAWWHQKNEKVYPIPLLNGHEVMNYLHLSPSKVVGIIIEQLKEAQAEGVVKTKEEAYEFITTISNQLSKQ